MSRFHLVLPLALLAACGLEPQEDRKNVAAETPPAPGTPLEGGYVFSDEVIPSFIFHGDSLTFYSFQKADPANPRRILTSVGKATFTYENEQVKYQLHEHSCAGLPAAEVDAALDLSPEGEFRVRQTTAAGKGLGMALILHEWGPVLFEHAVPADVEIVPACPSSVVDGAFVERALAPLAAPAGP